jgi:transposase
VRQLGLDPTKLVFIDETWAKTNMTRLRGRCLRGERLIARVPHGHWKTTTLIAALDHQGMRCSMTVDGAINREVFEAFVEKILLPTLSPGDIVVMDNLSSHKGQRVRSMIESTGASVLFLPPYSPDLNPIEPAFAKLKQLLRSAEHRQVTALWNDMQRMLDCISPTDSTNFFRHCGYGIQGK